MGYITKLAVLYTQAITAEVIEKERRGVTMLDKRIRIGP